MHGPDPLNPHPMKGFPQIAFLKNVVTSPRIIVGDYTYFDDPEGPENFEKRNVLYHFDFMDDRLVIGRFCAIARGVRFIMNGANHPMRGFSTYPFHIFGEGWEPFACDEASEPPRGDTVVGNDVWIGYGAVILPGVTIGDGAIIGACAVVTRPVEPYTIVAGNPARPVKKRFDEETIARLLEVRWWDWPPERITANLGNIAAADKKWLASL